MICMITFPELHMYYADLAQPLTTAGEEPDDLDHDLWHLSDLWKPRKMGHVPVSIFFIALHQHTQLAIFLYKCLPAPVPSGGYPIFKSYPTPLLHGSTASVSYQQKHTMVRGKLQHAVLNF